ncbi:MAG TPA: DNA alkylation repair protein [Xanthobacteraceae bacterium]|nr:DNA alkylation repair protein [Xanthobacteraceae bacterium]
MLSDLRREFELIADPGKAVRMQAYMKSAMPYHGVPSPQVKQVCRKVFADLELSNRTAWQTQVLDIWRHAKYREERYAALNLCADRIARPFHEPRAMTMYENMIVTGAWWDYVDELSHRVGDILRRYPSRIGPVLRRWSRSDDLWKRRTSIICQRSFKTATDLDLLYACIEPSLESKEFFLQKAIGWALRQHAWTDPGEVTAYVKRESRLAPLSRREALKNL